jgi:hypothetical protein
LARDFSTRPAKPPPPSAADADLARSIDALVRLWRIDRLARLVEDLEHAVRNLPDRLAVALGENTLEKFPATY